MLHAIVKNDQTKDKIVLQSSKLPRGKIITQRPCKTNIFSDVV